MFADRYGMPFIAFRIGVRLREHGNRFGPWIPFGRWGQEMWVSTAIYAMLSSEPSKQQNRIWRLQPRVQ